MRRIRTSCHAHLRAEFDHSREADAIENRKTEGDPETEAGSDDPAEDAFLEAGTRCAPSELDFRVAVRRTPHLRPCVKDNALTFGLSCCDELKGRPAKPGFRQKSL
ncbi:hypothetical protein MRX96_025327 [Rhipicephalus microplus]